MLRKDLAAALGISTSMVKKCERRGMPLHDVELARRWRQANLDMARSKEFRADGNTGKAYEAKVAKRPPIRRRSASPRPGVAEANLFVSAALFALRFGMERFGPLLVHIGCHMTDDGHDVQQQCLDRGLDLTPPFEDGEWDAAADEYFEWLPVGCAEQDEVTCPGYEPVLDRIEAARAAKRAAG